MGLRMPGQSTQSSMLQNLATQTPFSQSELTKGQQAANNIRLQQASKTAAQTGQPMNAATIQNTAAQQTAAQAAPQVQAAEANLKTQGQIGQLGLQQQNIEATKNASERRRAISNQGRQLKAKLNTLSNGLQDKLIDQQMEFERDNLGQTFFNERQLADWAITKAKSEEDLRNYEQLVTQASKKRMQILKTASAKIQQTLSQGFNENQQNLDNAQRRELIIAKQKLEQKLKDEANKQANRASIFGAVGTIVGGAAGAFIGGPAGAVAGASLGSGVGQLAAGATSK